MSSSSNIPRHIYENLKVSPSMPDLVASRGNYDKKKNGFNLDNLSKEQFQFTSKNGSSNMMLSDDDNSSSISNNGLRVPVINDTIDRGHSPDGSIGSILECYASNQISNQISNHINKNNIDVVENNKTLDGEEQINNFEEDQDKFDLNTPIYDSRNNSTVSEITRNSNNNSSIVSKPHSLASIRSSRNSADIVRNNIEANLKKTTKDLSSASTHQHSSLRYNNSNSNNNNNNNNNVTKNNIKDPILLGDRDRYGFKKNSNFISANDYNEWWVDYSKYLIRRKKKWELMMNKNGFHTEKNKPPTRFPPKSDELKRFVRKGIPAEWRGNAWFYFAKGFDKLKDNVGVYDKLCEESIGLNNENSEAIEKDLNRTFPDNIHFNDHYGTPGIESPLIESLRRVLLCFSVYKPKIGYCQSLNFIAGLLLIFMDEEKSFWMLVIITEKYLPGIHDFTLEGVNIHQGVLLLCIKEYLPNVWPIISPSYSHGANKHNNEFLIRLPPLSLCTTSWFMSVFIGVLPIETTLRIWDCLFYEDSKTLFRVSLTIFKLLEPQLLSFTETHKNHVNGRVKNRNRHYGGNDDEDDHDLMNVEIFQIIQNFPKRLIDSNSLMESCFKKRNNGFNNLSQTEINSCKKFVREKREKFHELEKKKREEKINFRIFTSLWRQESWVKRINMEWEIK
ncbi:hypothetical protein PACTADRAFT_84424 [Pachysolen tannophilus NRRL Y-2460]|uniref:Rab-GAP TBC domain-containing protein n=1 Tax=Pachysolen tannophilus NRRL Y-2460 TaxID=669874 RepID=A0A1E4TZM1_PACTA|nr:hypothetical protein PACTADRAFT_84424 [Pachysolen tannophilus NRRL Y-2460]